MFVQRILFLERIKKMRIHFKTRISKTFTNFDILLLKMNLM